MRHKGSCCNASAQVNPVCFHLWALGYVLQIIQRKSLKILIWQSILESDLLHKDVLSKFKPMISNRSLMNLLFLPVKGSCMVVQARTTAFITQLIHCWLQRSHQVSSRSNIPLPSQRPRSEIQETVSTEPREAVGHHSFFLLVHQTRSG